MIPGPYETAVGQIRRPEEGDAVASLLGVFARLPGHIKKMLHDKHEYRSWYKYGLGPKKVWTNGVIALAYGASATAWEQFAAATDDQAKISESAVRNAAGTEEPYSRQMKTKKILQIFWSAPPVAEGGPPRWCYLQPIQTILNSARRQGIGENETLSELMCTQTRTQRGTFRTFDVFAAAHGPNLKLWTRVNCALHGAYQTDPIGGTSKNFESMIPTQTPGSEWVVEWAHGLVEV